MTHCQSCFMPMKKRKEFGTEENDKKSTDYCCYCYQKGNFTQAQTLAQAVENNIQFWKEDGDTSDDQARARIMEVFPTLKRWKSS